MANFFNYLRLPVIVTSSVAAVASGLLYWKQTELIYPRNLPVGTRTEEGVFKPPRFGVEDWDEVWIHTPDSERLHSYFIRANRTHYNGCTMLMFHGNAGNIGHRIPIAKMIERHVGCNVLMVEYRGYGLSTGSPDEKGLSIDAQAALDWIRKNDETKSDRILVYGQSLGGAVSIRLVTRNHGTGDIAGLVLENTFLSIVKMIPRVFPPAKYVSWLCHQRWESESIIGQIKDIPILFISGLKDEIIPPFHMKRLYALSQAKVKIWKELPNGSHNDSVAEPGYFHLIADFVKNYAMKTELEKEKEKVKL